MTGFDAINVLDSLMSCGSEPSKASNTALIDLYLADRGAASAPGLRPQNGAMPSWIGWQHTWLALIPGYAASRDPTFFACASSTRPMPARV